MLKERSFLPVLAAGKEKTTRCPLSFSSIDARGSFNSFRRALATINDGLHHSDDIYNYSSL